MGEKILYAGGSPLTNILNHGEAEMINFIIGIIVGLFLSTSGVTGVIEILEKGLVTVKAVNTTLEK
jgi:hypothetical protein